jgi:ribonuclease R
MVIKQSRNRSVKFFNNPKSKEILANSKHYSTSKSTILPSKYKVFEATFIGQSDSGYGFLRAVDTNNYKNGDILVDRNKKHTAIYGDQVQAEITGTTYNGRFKAKIVKIISRNVNPIPAYLQKQACGWRAVPLESKFAQIIAVQATDLAQEGDIVTVVLDPNLYAKQIQGTVTSRLGKITDLNIENKLTVAIFNLRTEFPQPAMEELSMLPTAIPSEQLCGRKDLRNELIITIDPPTAKDFDDAISIMPLTDIQGEGWLLGVHIADVSHYINEGGPLDQEAMKRGTSVYFPDQCIPMLPERLSGELCSLLEGVDRLAITVWITLDSKLQIVETSFAKSIIKSRKRLTYDQVKEACLDRSETIRKSLGPDICKLLEEALKISNGLTKIRLNRGALNLTSEETKFIFDEDSRPTDACRYVHHDAHHMIEEFMLLANEAIAGFFTNKKIPAIYRIHDEPDPLKLEIFREVASAFGLLESHEDLTPERLNILLKDVHDKPVANTLNTLLIRSLKKAEYSADNIGHSGLALTDYLHFTSPIRRYPDLVVHRLLCKIIQKSPLPNNLHGHLTILAKSCSHLEQTAAEAERENRRWKTCMIMRTKIGHKFDGQIIGFSKKIAFIRINSPFLEVSVPLCTISTDFVVDQHNIKVFSNDTNTVLTIGDEATVEITGIDEDSRRVYAYITKLPSQQYYKNKIIGVCPISAAPVSTREVNFIQNTPLHFKHKTKCAVQSKQTIQSGKCRKRSARKTHTKNVVTLQKDNIISKSNIYSINTKKLPKVTKTKKNHTKRNRT